MLSNTSISSNIQTPSTTSDFHDLSDNDKVIEVLMKILDESLGDPQDLSYDRNLETQKVIDMIENQELKNLFVATCHRWFMANHFRMDNMSSPVKNKLFTNKDLDVIDSIFTNNPHPNVKEFIRIMIRNHKNQLNEEIYNKIFELIVLIRNQLDIKENDEIVKIISGSNRIITNDNINKKVNKFHKIFEGHHRNIKVDADEITNIIHSNEPIINCAKNEYHKILKRYYQNIDLNTYTISEFDILELSKLYIEEMYKLELSEIARIALGTQSNLGGHLLDNNYGYCSIIRKKTMDFYEEINKKN